MRLWNTETTERSLPMMASETTQPNGIVWGAAVLIWVGCITGVSAALYNYEFSAGSSANAPEHIEGMTTARRHSNELLVFLHAKCPCSVATVEELKRVVLACSENMNTTVYLLHDDENEPETRVVSLVRQIPGIQIVSDSCGIYARSYGAKTSGQTLLYNSHGDLLFNGGITASRGHQGDNPGSRAIIAITMGQPVAEQTIQHPVFGCALWDD